MRKSLVLLCWLAVTAAALADEPTQITCTGTVVDEQGQPLAGATVTAYRRARDDDTVFGQLKKMATAQTPPDGTFSFEFVITERFASGFVVAMKEGLAMGWGNWQTREPDCSFDLKLGPPKVLAGKVVDENGSPIAGAVVRTSMTPGEDTRSIWIQGLPAFDRLMTRTDRDGRFSFDQIPADARADFMITAPGRALTTTFKRGSYGGRRLNFSPSQPDISITLPVEGRVEGAVVAKETGQPAAGIRLRLRTEQAASGWENRKCVSGDNGRFTIEGLGAGLYILTVLPPKDETDTDVPGDDQGSKDDMTDWVAAPVMVTVKTGQTLSDIKVQLSEGSFVQVTVTDEADGRPIADARVGLYDNNRQQSASGKTNQQGVARLRVLPGEHQLSTLYKEGYAQMFPRTQLVVTEGQAETIAVELKVEPKIHGLVTDATGQPVSGAEVQVLPGRGRGGPTTDEQGRFETSSQTSGWRGQTPERVILVRHLERNLAAAVVVQDETKPVEVRLQQGAVLTGRVTDPAGEPIHNARISVMLRHTSWGASIQRRDPLRPDAQGRYEIRAIPTGRKYALHASAEGFGTADVQIELAEQEERAVEVDPLILPPANSTVSGVVVDADDKPVPNAHVTVAGGNQPHRRVPTDEKGRFVIEGVVEQEMHVRADVTIDNQRQAGSVQATGGDSDVRIVLGYDAYSGQRAYTPPRSLTGKALPALASFHLQPASELAADRPVLICFWDMHQRPARRTVRMLSTKADDLKARGVVVITVHASAADESDVQQWAAKHQLNFPVGMVSDDKLKARRTLRRWGVRSVPWLILTDAQHVVKAHGFDMDQLDATLAGLTGQ